MIDGWARRRIDPLITRLARPLATIGVTANRVTLAGCAIGIGAALAITAQYYLTGLMLILLSRLCDGLDGAIARIRGEVTDYGGYLDIVLDFLFYGAIPMAFAIADPAKNALPGATLIFAFHVNGASFLAFAAIAARRGLESDLRGPKSIFFTAGLAEAGETLALFIAFCLLPGWFAPLAYIFSGACLLTAAARIVRAYLTFRS